MIEFKTLSLRNFLSFGNSMQTVDLNKNHYTLLTGYNMDKIDNNESDGNRNGCGKTVIMHALHYALYGKSINNKINLPTLVNNINKKNMQVVLTFTKNGVDYKIERGRKPEYLKLTVGNDEITDETLGDSRRTQDVINEIIGISEDLFCQTVILSCSVPMFYDQSTANQKLLIEEVLGIDILTKKITALKELIKNTKNELNTEQFKYQTNVDTYNKLKTNKEELIINLKNSIKSNDTNRDMCIKQYESEINKLNGIDVDKETRLLNDYNEYLKSIDVYNTNYNQYTSLIKDKSNYEYKISDIKNRLERLSSIDIEKEKSIHSDNEKIRLEMEEHRKLMDEKKVLQSRYDELNNGYNTLLSELKKLKANKESYLQNKCPTCGQMLDAKDTTIIISQIDGQIEQYDSAMHTVNMEIMDIVDKLSKYPDDKKFSFIPSKYSLEELMNIGSEIASLCKELETNMMLVNDIDVKIRDIDITKPTEPTEKSIFSNVNDILEIKFKKEGLQKSIEDTKKRAEETNEQYKTLIESAVKELDSLTVPSDEEISKLQSEQEHNEYLLKLLNSPSSYIRKAILDKSLDYLNNRIKHYLLKMGSLHTVKFDNDMSLDISYRGNTYGYISSGEMGRVSIALNLAFRDAWESLTGERINLMMCDEIIDNRGLDTNGKDMVVKVLSENDRNIWVVSHDTNIISGATNVVTVVKERDFSNIKI